MIIIIIQINIYDFEPFCSINKKFSFSTLLLRKRIKKMFLRKMFNDSIMTQLIKYKKIS